MLTYADQVDEKLRRVGVRRAGVSSARRTRKPGERLRRWSAVRDAAVRRHQQQVVAAREAGGARRVQRGEHDGTVGVSQLRQLVDNLVSLKRVQT